MPKQDGILEGIPIDEKRGLRFAMHGYFRAPMRITKVPRAEGSTKPQRGQQQLPHAVPRRRRLLPLGLRLHAGQRDRLRGALSLRRQRQGHGDHPVPGQPLLGRREDRHRRQPGLSQGWLTYRTEPRLRSVLQDAPPREGRRVLGALRLPAEIRHVHLRAHPPDGRERPARVREGRLHLLAAARHRHAPRGHQQQRGAHAAQLREHRRELGAHRSSSAATSSTRRRATSAR